MQRVLKVVTILSLVTMMLSPAAFATNGDNLIAIGPIARAMGGVGIAAPQDAISAVFANPAAMCFGPYCPSSEINFAGTLFMPKVDAEINRGGEVIRAESDEKVYAIPAFGLSIPITSKPPFWRFGLSAYGITGMGVDYRDTAIDQPHYAPYGGSPLVSGEYTQLQIMKFAPAIAFQPFEQLSFGLALHVDYASLDLRNGSSSNYGIGAQVGMIYKLNEHFSFGLNYVSPQNVDHDNVADLDQDGDDDTVKLESPHQVGLGLAYQMRNNLLIEGDIKWLNWSGANGYDDFDWDDQWVFAVGAQYRPMPKLVLRAGYNYGKNPVNEHDGFAGDSLTTVQGKTMPSYYYETFRLVGLPAVVEHHLTAGIGYEFSPKFSLHAGYVHAFEKTVSETGTDLTGQPVSIESSLSENSVDLGLTWRF